MYHFNCNNVRRVAAAAALVVMSTSAFAQEGGRVEIDVLKARSVAWMPVLNQAFGADSTAETVMAAVDNAGGTVDIQRADLNAVTRSPVSNTAIGARSRATLVLAGVRNR